MTIDKDKVIGEMACKIYEYNVKLELIRGIVDKLDIFYKENTKLCNSETQWSLISLKNLLDDEEYYDYHK